MVSPLRIWQHPEPKGLWPALGGLAVVAHVGVIGLSLPYVSGLVGGGGGSAAAVVPIELIVDVATESTPVETAALAPGNNTPEDEQSDSARPVAPTPAVKQAPTTVAKTSVSETPIEQPSPAEEQNQQDNEGAADSEVPSKEASEEEETQELAEQGDEAPDEVPPSDREAETTPSEETPSNEEEDLPALEGRQLPSPGEASTSEGIDQFTALSFTGYDPNVVPKGMRRDPFVTVPPEATQIASITGRPQDLGCAKVGELPPTQLTYRVTISQSGTIQAATPWTGRIEVAAPLSESEAAVECLLKQSGWRFTPGLDDEGNTYPFSDGILTFTLRLQTD